MRDITAFSPAGLANFREFLSLAYGERYASGRIDESACISECIDACQGALNAGETMTWEIRSVSTESRRPEVFRPNESDFVIVGHMVDISIDDGLAPLHCVYPGQTSPQPAYLEFEPDPDNDTQTLAAEYSGEIGNAVPMNVWHGVVIRLNVPATTQGAALRALQDDREFAALIQRIVDGYSVAYDGSNHRGQLDADAQQAVNEAESWLSDLDQAEVWDVADWLAPGVYLCDAIKRATIQDYADYLVMGIEPNQVIDGDIAETAAELLARLLPDNPERWTADHRRVAQMLAAYSDEYSDLIAE